MKKFILFYPMLLLTLGARAQYNTASGVFVYDTRNSDEVPIQFDKIVHFDFKARSTVNVPGSGTFSGMMTFAPWGDATGDMYHQLNFNNGGIYYRQGLAGSNWGMWRAMIMEGPDGRVRTDKELHLNKGGNNLILTAGTLDHSYMSFYARTNAPDQRSGWFGFGSGGGSNISVANELPGGNIILATNGGNVGIDVDPKEKLSVKGTIKAEKIKVTIKDWPDYVFNPDYTLPSLQETARYITEHKHLPDIPAAAEVEESGLDVGEMNKKLLQKVEELTLHLIEQQKVIQSQQTAITQLNKDVQSMKQQLKH
ncbi:hypothetical protein [Chitinophaga sp. HK235]|uniref:hypothetical protein n=1 Tax=Chitinophaga sp. HK235 TaxID=2952571 RepID=UPI001BAA3F8D|nr:hypothetical protein [Chitinophaga sp. HK235]